MTSKAVFWWPVCWGRASLAGTYITLQVNMDFHKVNKYQKQTTLVMVQSSKLDIPHFQALQRQRWIIQFGRTYWHALFAQKLYINTSLTWRRYLVLLRIFWVLSKTMKNSGVMGDSREDPLMMATSSGVSWKHFTNASATVSCMCSLLLWKMICISDSKQPSEYVLWVAHESMLRLKLSLFTDFANLKVSYSLSVIHTEPAPACNYKPEST